MKDFLKGSLVFRMRLIIKTMIYLIAQMQKIDSMSII